MSKTFLRNKHSGLSALLPVKYLDIFPDVFEEVRTGKPVVPELYKKADEKPAAPIIERKIEPEDGK